MSDTRCLARFFKRLARELNGPDDLAKGERVPLCYLPAMPEVESAEGGASSQRISAKKIERRTALAAAAMALCLVGMTI